MKNLNILSVATFLILISFTVSGFRLITDVFNAGTWNKIVVIPLVSLLILFFLIFLVGQNKENADKIK
jgi:hypothetical protein